VRCTAAEALHAVAAANPEVPTVDITLGDSSGIELNKMQDPRLAVKRRKSISEFLIQTPIHLIFSRLGFVR
jgi:hypothetical protein